MSCPPNVRRPGILCIVPTSTWAGAARRPAGGLRGGRVNLLGFDLTIEEIAAVVAVAILVVAVLLVWLNREAPR